MQVLAVDKKKKMDLPKKIAIIIFKTVSNTQSGPDNNNNNNNNDKFPRLWYLKTHR